jgi:hypothetical protein
MEEEIFSINIRDYKAIALTFIEKLKSSSDSVVDILHVWIFDITIYLVVNIISVLKSVDFLDWNLAHWIHAFILLHWRNVTSS